MHPTRDQIERAAYDRWLRRHRAHGHDRDDWVGSENELTYLLNYQTVVEYPLDSSSPIILGRPGRCSFCERTSSRATFSQARAIVQGIAERSLLSAQICDECQEDCRDPLAVHCENFWNMIHAGGDAHGIVPGRDVDSLAVFKSLVASALLIMPEGELAYFADTLEWVNNPDHEFDRSHFDGTYFHLYYNALFLGERSWISLARRSDDLALFPYMVLFLAWNGVVLQTSVPMSVRDHDLEGRCARMPQRSLIAGEGPHFHEARSSVLRLSATLPSALGRLLKSGRSGGSRLGASASFRSV